jgi:class 3 adenylate cyclase
MKKILILIFLIPVCVFGQTESDTLHIGVDVSSLNNRMKELNHLFQANLETKPSQSLKYATDMLELSKATDNAKGKLIALNHLAKVNKALGNRVQSIENSMLILELEEMIVLQRMQEDYLLLYNQYNQKGDVKSALEYFRLYTAVTDSISKRENDKQSTELKKLQNQAGEVIVKDLEIKKLAAGKASSDKQLKMAKLEVERNASRINILRKDQAIKEMELEEVTLEKEKKVKELAMLQKNKEIKELELKQLKFQEEKRENKIRILNQEKEINELELEKEKTVRTFAITVSVLLLITAFVLYNRYSHKKEINIQLASANEQINHEKDLSDKLLLNILPAKVANDLKTNGFSEPRYFDDVTVYFSDFVGFTKRSSNFEPKELIKELNEIFTEFDNIIERNNCERIKTIGDAYLAVCGMPESNDNHSENIINSAIGIIEYLRERNKTSLILWEPRIGIHSGRVVGGVVGIKKYIYDVFGDTINTASRMESYSESMMINVSNVTYEFVKDKFKFTKRKPILVKGKGVVQMYFVDC